MMRSWLASAWSIAVKDWKRFVRQPFLMIISVAIPLVFIFFYSIIVPLSATGPIMIADEDHSAQSAALIEQMRDIRSVEAPYYEVVTTDAATARQAFENQTSLAMVVIPQGFDDAVDSGDAKVELRLNNINSDYSKNLRLRLDLAVKNLDAELTHPIAVVHETSWLPSDPTMLGYISTSLLLFGCLYAGMVNTGLGVASEWNDRTVKALLLAPVRRGTLVAGKVIAGLGQSLVSEALVLVVLVVGFGFRPVGSLWQMAAIMAMTTFMGAGIGAAFGVASKKTLAASSSLIALAIMFFLVCGNEESMRGLAWSQPMESLWGLSRLLPPTYSFLAARSIFLTGESSNLTLHLTIVALSAAAVLLLASWLLRRAYNQLTGGNA